ncbi:hypothetical protein GOBAR_AA27169 [Gossypium barbadense]|uniref:Uncharacterized protein n=1 Tax=Gossypium barbadense TaxID=3634 RepID=A0A2P5WR23_GOSBA|nr:hypothetical protein GOBAR_AA27169 [Gossypium barbadense]
MACRYLKEGEIADALERLGSVIEVGHDILNMEGRAKFKCKLKMGPEDDAAPFHFFEARTVVFLPRDNDIVPT